MSNKKLFAKRHHRWLAELATDALLTTTQIRILSSALVDDNYSFNHQKFIAWIDEARAKPRVSAFPSKQLPPMTKEHRQELHDALHLKLTGWCNECEAVGWLDERGTIKAEEPTT